ncbi:hypothetical protein BU25DRAFT_426018 [Macroventuria anomochaeta]|uniref:Uncharacterized protein n=1 Tax=Macroventuria anomochaeta TaxID=301207 RepID=A0ACB6RJJ2_9PLEO|nr:uncharacterized protein BU25DRAFT_426018 [Macroventuria anomochaeta]KAF2622061.1 hypothetical protein BU25DRAFT_426018 [Macroventuria anomochaeta]
MDDNPTLYECHTGMLDPRPRDDRASAMFGRNATMSPLLCLPAELRNRVFAYILGGYEFKLQGGWNGRCQARHILSDVGGHGILGLLRTCRQIYAETRMLPFALNTFSCDDYPTVERWVRRIPVQMRTVRFLKVSWIISPTSNDNRYRRETCGKRFDSHYILSQLEGVIKAEVELRNDGFENKATPSMKQCLSEASLLSMFPEVEFVFTCIE